MTLHLDRLRSRSFVLSTSGLGRVVASWAGQPLRGWPGELSAAALSASTPRLLHGCPPRRAMDSPRLRQPGRDNRPRPRQHRTICTTTGARHRDQSTRSLDPGLSGPEPRHSSRRPEPARPAWCRSRSRSHRILLASPAVCVSRLFARSRSPARFGSGRNDGPPLGPTPLIDSLCAQLRDHFGTSASTPGHPESALSPVGSRTTLSAP